MSKSNLRLDEVDGLILAVYNVVYLKSPDYQFPLIDVSDLNLDRFKLSDYDLDTIFDKTKILYANKYWTGLRSVQTDPLTDIYQYVFKRKGESQSTATNIRLVEYSTDAAMNDMADPVNVNQIIRTLFSELVVLDRTNNILMPIINVDVMGADLVKYDKVQTVLDANKISKRKFSVEITEKFYSLTTLEEFMRNYPLELATFKSIIYQIVDIIYLIHTVYSEFRNRQMIPEMITVYTKLIDGVTMPEIKLSNFFLASIGTMIPNNYLKNVDIPTVETPYDDLYQFLNNLWNNYGLEIVKYPELIKLFDAILPKSIRSKNMYLTPDLWKKLSEDEKDSLKIKNIRNNSFFKEPQIQHSKEYIEPQEEYGISHTKKTHWSVIDPENQIELSDSVGTIEFTENGKDNDNDDDDDDNDDDDDDDDDNDDEDDDEDNPEDEDADDIDAANGNIVGDVGENIVESDIEFGPDDEDTESDEEEDNGDEDDEGVGEVDVTTDEIDTVNTNDVNDIMTDIKDIDSLEEIDKEDTKSPIIGKIKSFGNDIDNMSKVSRTNKKRSNIANRNPNQKKSEFDEIEKTEKEKTDSRPAKIVTVSSDSDKKPRNRKPASSKIYHGKRTVPHLAQMHPNPTQNPTVNSTVNPIYNNPAAFNGYYLPKPNTPPSNKINSLGNFLGATEADYKNSFYGKNLPVNQNMMQATQQMSPQIQMPQQMPQQMPPQMMNAYMANNGGMSAAALQAALQGQGQMNNMAQPQPNFPAGIDPAMMQEFLQSSQQSNNNSEYGSPDQQQMLQLMQQQQLQQQMMQQQMMQQQNQNQTGGAQNPFFFR